MAASNTFSARHPSLSTNRTAKQSRTQTISKKDIDSTPKLVSKLDHHEPPNMDNLVIENVTRESSSAGSSKPTTPKSQRGVEIISNKGAESAGSSQESEATPYQGWSKLLQSLRPSQNHSSPQLMLICCLVTDTKPSMTFLDQRILSWHSRKVTLSV